jgi:predicted transcriptional regulator
MTLKKNIGKTNEKSRYHVRSVDDVRNLDTAIFRGLADADAGRVNTVDEVRQQLRQRNTPKGLRST